MNTVTLDRRHASRSARRLVAADCASAAIARECAEAAELMTSEIVTNAVLHGDGQITVGISVDSHRCRVEVADESPSRPRLHSPDELAEGGRGMLIVEELASDWGVTPLPSGKIVWFEVSAQT